ASFWKNAADRPSGCCSPGCFAMYGLSPLYSSPLSSMSVVQPDSRCEQNLIGYSDEPLLRLNGRHLPLPGRVSQHNVSTYNPTPRCPGSHIQHFIGVQWLFYSSIRVEANVTSPQAPA